MIKYTFKKIFGSANDRALKRLSSIIQQVNELESKYAGLSDSELKDCTNKFRETYQKTKNLDKLLPDAFATVREAAKRVLKMRHFDVQIIGGIVLHNSMIAEMKTGEGKTLMSTLPAYLNAIPQKGVHIVTVNDYLAKRDSEWMGKIFEFLGLTVGVIQNGMDDEDRRNAYHSDITYGTNNEFGFDYLRDNMKFNKDELVQRREFHYAIIDEVDSILIDEARTPLIISGMAEDSTAIYYEADRFVKKIKSQKDAYEIDEKTKSIVLSENGINAAEDFFKINNLYDLSNMDILHQINQSLKGHFIFNKDKDYLIKDNKVQIVDEFTGRVMEGRRYSDGLHQALEAKEGVKIEQESQTMAQITFQNYFRMYDKLSGMTGTAVTESEEFLSIYNLNVMEVPTNKPMIRKDMQDVIYATEKEKWDAVINNIKEVYEKGQPVLVGTISIENSEIISKRLKKEKIPHVVLNAKYHEQEADIVALAGRVKGVTIATNMAGRGTDIILGGNAEYLIKEKLKNAGYKITTAPDIVLEKAKTEAVKEAKDGHEKVKNYGGLYILGTERHESRRIDNQLRGRAGRQGDPGLSKFYISLEDDLMKIMGSDRIKALLQRVGMNSGVEIQHKFISRAIENAQKQIESQNFSIRKHLLEYDDVMNKQRQVIYQRRKEILFGKDLSSKINEIIEDLVVEIIDRHFKNNSEVDLKSFSQEIKEQFNLEVEAILQKKFNEYDSNELETLIVNKLKEHYQEKGKYINKLYQEFDSLMENDRNKNESYMREIERDILLNIIDVQWKDHLRNMDYLREGINLRGYAQQDPLMAYKKESFEIYQEMECRIEDLFIKWLFNFSPDFNMEDLEKFRKKRDKKKKEKPISKMPGRKRKKKK